ncbi:MAG: NBR1-Ig-like domain-containing protein, partial [Limisphaerales bacterium]
MQQDPVNAGQNATFTFNSTAPTTAGTYNFNWEMVRDGVQWFGAKATASIQVAAINDASTVRISAPASVVAGSSFSATITMNNSGNLSWTTAGNYALGSQSPQDNNTWGTGRVGLTADPITAGQNAAFTRTFTAPTSPGTYTFAWKMVQDGVEWFGATASTTITVTGNLVTAIVDNSDAGLSVTGTSWIVGTSATQKYGADYRFRSTAPVSEPAQWVANLANTGT